MEPRKLKSEKAWLEIIAQDFTLEAFFNIIKIIL